MKALTAKHQRILQTLDEASTGECFRKRWSGQTVKRHADSHGESYAPQVTWKACLWVASRRIQNATRLEEPPTLCPS
jgi:hypothetical protein